MCRIPTTYFGVYVVVELWLFIVRSGGLCRYIPTYVGRYVPTYIVKLDLPIPANGICTDRTEGGR